MRKRKSGLSVNLFTKEIGPMIIRSTSSLEVDCVHRSKQGSLWSWWMGSAAFSWRCDTQCVLKLWVTAFLGNNSRIYSSIVGSSLVYINPHVARVFMLQQKSLISLNTLVSFLSKRNGSKHKPLWLFSLFRSTHILTAECGISCCWLTPLSRDISPYLL